MANTFYRFPNPGGDTNVGATYNQYQLESTLGLITSQLYNDGGDLKLKTGRIGIDNGSTKGIISLDTEVTVDLSGVSNETWAKIEVSVSGTAPSFTALDIASATDPTEAPAAFKNSYNGEKGGFYISTTKRCIGLAWKNSSGVLLAIINVCPHINDYWASEIGLHTDTIHKQEAPRKGFVVEIGAWDMDTTASVNVAWFFYIFFISIANIKILIQTDSESASSFNDLRRFSDNADPQLVAGGINQYYETQISLRRRTSGPFDAPLFSSALINRGWITVHMRDF